MKRGNSTSTIVVGLLLVALIGAVILVGRNQETRRGAYFSGTKMLVLPETISTTVGQEVPVQLWVDTANNAKVSSVDMEFCYGDKMEPASNNNGDMAEAVTLNQEAFKVLLEATQVQGKNCAHIVALSTGLTPENLKSGLVRVASVKLKAKGVGTGKIEYSTENTVAGYNPTPGATDASLKIDEKKMASYTVAEAAKYSRGACNATTGKYSCVADANGDYTSLTSCEEAAGCEINTQTLLLKYKVAFGDVPANAKCAVNWPMQVIVLGNGVTGVYNNMVPERDTSITDRAVYKGTVRLVGFDYGARNNMAAFFKGSKHLQMKYGVNGQEGPYNKAGGELVLKGENEADQVEYDFSKYPMLAGDVTNQAGNGQDGIINGLDFKYIKTKSLTHETVAEGSYLLADLDGNCQLNSNDVNILKKSLSEKQGQLY